MKYGVLKLDFHTAVHFGNDTGTPILSYSDMTLHSDTVFSALCTEAIKKDASELKWLYEMTAEGKLAISDALPYIEEKLYSPKPIISIESDIKEQDTSKRKLFKNLKYIAYEDLGLYIEYMLGKTDFMPEKTTDLLKTLGNHEVRTLAAIHNGKEDAEPYHVGVFRFNDKKGLYIVIGYEEDKDFQRLIMLFKSLGLSGIGGKRTSGFGKFTLEDEIYLEDASTKDQQILNTMLCDDTANYFMTISTSMFNEEELKRDMKDSYFSLVRRGGFVQSETYSDNMQKKKTTYSFVLGSCFKEKFNGCIRDVSIRGNHPVYRYQKPMFLGVRI